MYNFGPPRPLSDVLHRKMVREVSGDMFAGAAVAIAPGDDFEPKEIATPPLSLVTRLQRAKPRTPDEKRLIQTMVQELMAIELGATELLADIDGERREELEKQLEEIRKRGREQQKVINSLESDRQQKEFAFHSARNYAESCRDELNSLHTTRVSRWASKADRDALAKKITRAEDAVRQANAELVRATSAHNDAANDVQAAQQRMGEISNCEIRVRGELSGKVFKDPETGLPILPTM